MKRYGTSSQLRRFGPGELLLLPLVIVFVLYGIPIVNLIWLSFGENDFTLKHYTGLFSYWSYGDVLLRTLRVSAAVVVVSLFFGYAIAYVLAFSSTRLRIALSFLILLPFWTSILVRNFAWTFLLQGGGLLAETATFVIPGGQQVELLYNEVGVIIGMSNTLLPFMVFPIFVALATQKASLREAAASLGAPPARIFTAVTLPLSWNGVVAGSLLVFTTAAGFFITPALLGGGRVLMAATFIDLQVQELIDWPTAAAASTILLVAIILLIVAFRNLLSDALSRPGHVD